MTRGTIHGCGLLVGGLRTGEPRHPRDRLRLEFPRITSTDLNGLTCKIAVDTDLRRDPPAQRAPSEALEAQDDAGHIQRIGRGWDRPLAACRYSSSRDDGIR